MADSTKWGSFKFNKHRRQDAEGFLSFLFDTFCPTLLEIWLIVNVRSNVRCAETSCNATKFSGVDAQRPLHATIGSTTSVRPIALQKALRYEEWETLDTTNNVRDVCNKPGHTEQQLICLPETWPKHLIVHVKRYGYNTKGEQQKIETEVTYPLGHFTMPNDGPRYFVRSVICHIGKWTTVGHYYTIVRQSDADDADWVVFNDSKRSDTLAHRRLYDIVTKDAYLLFLEKVEEDVDVVVNAAAAETEKAKAKADADARIKAAEIAKTAEMAKIEEEKRAKTEEEKRASAEGSSAAMAANPAPLAGSTAPTPAHGDSSDTLLDTPLARLLRGMHVDPNAPVHDARPSGQRVDPRFR